jgi:hypothetical protein
MKNSRIMLKILFLIYAILFIQSCKKLTCKDDNLTIVRTDNNSDKLRLNGYYYGDISGINAEYPNIYLLYQNGIFANANSFGLSDAETGNVLLNSPLLMCKHKGDWGVYKIDGDNIEIEDWVSRSCGGVGIFYEKGIILNDTTFKITYWRRSVGGDIEKEEDVDAVFRFQHYSPKPDSIISFIK